MTSESHEGRADTTRQQILRAASRRFARQPYHEVGLDDILAEAELTKGAMYFHFRSKHALALAIIEQNIATGGTSVDELLARRLSGLETLIDFTYLTAVSDITDDFSRAGLHLLETVGRSEELHTKLIGGWVESLALVTKQAIAEGDVVASCDPHDVGQLVVSMYLGLRQTGNLDDPERFLLDLERCWALVLAGILQPDRLQYFRQFVRRRAALAVSGALAALSN